MKCSRFSLYILTALCACFIAIPAYAFPGTLEVAKDEVCESIPDDSGHIFTDEELGINTKSANRVKVEVERDQCCVAGTDYRTDVDFCFCGGPGSGDPTTGTIKSCFPNIFIHAGRHIGGVSFPDDCPGC